VIVEPDLTCSVALFSIELLGLQYTSPSQCDIGRDPPLFITMGTTMTPEIQKKMQKLIDTFYQRSDTEPFRQPVDWKGFGK